MGMDPLGETADISFPFGRVAAAFAIRPISGSHEHDKLDPMTAFTLQPIKSPGWSFLPTTTALEAFRLTELVTSRSRTQI